MRLLTLLGFTAAFVSLGAHADMAPWEKSLYEAAKKEKEFTVYTAHYTTQIAADVCDAFNKKYAGVTCKFVRTTAQVAMQRFQQELKSGVAVCSVFSSTDVGHYPALKQQGVLAMYKPHNLGNMVD